MQDIMNNEPTSPLLSETGETNTHDSCVHVNTCPACAGTASNQTGDCFVCMVY